MSASILSTLLLVSPAPLPVSAQPPALVEPESGAWAMVHAGQLWVCWSPGPDCFERIVFEDERSAQDHALEEELDLEMEELADDLQPSPDLGAEAWRLGFWGPRSLWIERGDQRWRVAVGQRRARVVDEPAPIRLRRIAVPACSPSGLIPTVIGGRISWREAPRCAVEVAARTCVRPAGPRLRKPTPVRLRAGIELGHSRGWTAQDDLALGLAIAGRRRAHDVEVALVVELGFDLQRRAEQERARALVERRDRTQVRELPAVVPGPRAEAEHDALARIVCGGGRP